MSVHELTLKKTKSSECRGDLLWHLFQMHWLFLKVPSDLYGFPYLQLGGRGEPGSTHVLSETKPAEPHLTIMKVGYWDR